MERKLTGVPASHGFLYLSYSQWAGIRASRIGGEGQTHSTQVKGYCNESSYSAAHLQMVSHSTWF